MAKKLIYLEDAIDAINALHEKPNAWLDSAVDAVMSLPSAKSEQKKGKWEKVYLDHVAFGERPSIFYCSSCNQCVPFPTNFCPACGSDNRQS